MRTPVLLVACLCLCTETRGALRTTGVLRRGGGRQVGVSGDGQPLRRFKRGWMWNQFFLLEEYTGSDNQYVGKLHSDKDREDGTVRYVLSGEGAGTIFVIDENSGDLHATRRLDREEKAFYMLSAKAVDKLTGRDLEGPSQFTIKIHDINDNGPQFTKDPYIASVQEMADVGTFVVQVTATDADDATYGNSAKVVYSILLGQPYFSVEPETGIIRTALPNMKREVRENYQVVIQAKDMAGQMGGLSGTTTVNITLQDINNNPPRFLQGVYQFSVSESSDPGRVIGTLSATDADTGRNAEMEYTIMDEQDMFQISTNRRTQEGVITLRKHLDYERKRMYSLRVQVENMYLDPRFHSRDSFRDTATIKISVEDEDEPPAFKRPAYVMEVKEDAVVGTVIGSVSAVDPDAKRVPIRYLIDWRTDMDHVFNIHPNNGSVYISRPLDREEHAWHNISVQAAEYNNRVSHVPVYIRVLDVNDNLPAFDTTYEPLVCERTRAGQRIQTVSASDADQPIEGHRFYFSLAPEASEQTNFTIIDNKDNTASVVTVHSGHSRLQRGTYLVPVVISDGEPPVQSSTATLTVRVCACDRHGDPSQCSADAHALAAGLSTGALVAILLCVAILLVTVVLFTAMRRQTEKMEPLIMSKEDVRDNVVSYNDEGGGEEDTQAFDIGTLRHPEVMDDSAHRRDIVPETLYPPGRWPGPRACDHADVRDFISQRLQENDCDPTAPPYDSLATYAYEGGGSVAESLSSLQTHSSPGLQDYGLLGEWGPSFSKLADLYGGEESDRDS